MVIAEIDSTPYNVMLFIHILSAIVAFAPAFVWPFVSMRLKKAGKPVGPTISELAGGSTSAAEAAFTALPACSVIPAGSGRGAAAKSTRSSVRPLTVYNAAAKRHIAAAAKMHRTADLIMIASFAGAFMVFTAFKIIALYQLFHRRCDCKHFSNR